MKRAILSRPLLWSVAAIILVAASAVLIYAYPPARTAALDRLGDEKRNDIIAVTSRINAPSLDTADMVPIQHVGVNQMGVNTFLEQEAEISKRRETFQVIKDAGIGWVRQQFPWEDIEIPAKGQYWDEKNERSTWEKYDNIVDLANEYGVNLIVRLDLPPKWAHPNNPWPQSPPENFEDYGDFVSTVVSRYRGKVHYYQLWNEPNLAIEWGSKPVNAADYVRLLKIGYQRAKEADPTAVILSAALAPTIEQSWRALDDRIYLQQMYDAGVKGYFDVMSVMAYGLRSGPDDRRLDLKDVNFSRPMLTRQIMVRNGDASKPIWASEMGWNVQPESVTAEPVFGRVSESLQARYTVRGFQRAAEEWPWMGVMNLWFLKRADDRDRNQPFYYFRMMEPDFTPLPVYQAVKQYGANPPTMNRGFSQEDHWAIQYQGSWKFVEDPRASLGKMAAADAGATLSVRFRGTDLTLVVPKGPSLGKAYLQIDGFPGGANRLPRDGSGRAVLDLSAAEASWQQQIPVAYGLPDTVHTLTLTADGPFDLDGLIVDVHGPSLLPRAVAGAAVALLLVAVSGFAILLARRRRSASHA